MFVLESDAGDDDLYEVDDDVDDEVMNVSFEEVQERKRTKKVVNTKYSRVYRKIINRVCCIKWFQWFVKHH